MLIRRAWENVPKRPLCKLFLFYLTYRYPSLKYKTNSPLARFWIHSSAWEVTSSILQTLTRMGNQKSGSANGCPPATAATRWSLPLNSRPLTAHTKSKRSSPISAEMEPNRCVYPSTTPSKACRPITLTLCISTGGIMPLQLRS